MTDDEVALVFKGMSKSVQLTNAVDLDTAIEQVNKYYKIGFWKVSVSRVIKKGQTAVNGTYAVCLFNKNRSALKIFYFQTYIYSSTNY